MSRCITSVELSAVKTITITIPETLDAAAAAEARRLGISKSALIRRGLEAVLPATTTPRDDPWVELAGFGPADVTVEPGDIDREVYGA